MEIVLKNLVTELDPFDIYTGFKDEKNTIFLDSGRDFENLGRYSFIGLNPFLTLKGKDDTCVINEVEHKCDIFEKISEILKEYKSDNNTHLPFIGGGIGYFSYDLSLKRDNIKLSNSIDDVEIPHFYFVFYDNLIIFDNLENKKYISACGILKNCNDSIKEIEDKIAQLNQVEYDEVVANNVELNSNFSREAYVKAVSKVKDYIRSGDIYITNLTQRYWAKTQRSSYDIYKDLRNINPAPFAALMNFDDFEIISSSPERFLKIDKRLVETRPIKGTRPRGSTPEEDEFYKNELLNSEKDKSELLMIVDLERNDLSKICKPNSVKVTELFKLEEYSTVFHLVSTVLGNLNDEADAVDCFKNCFPGGSITGTPKIRAMEIIDELEGIRRTAYTGSIGYFAFDGNADFNIVIRTILKKGEKVYFGVGGGITWDSEEEAEYEETLDKAKALIRVI